MSIKVRTEAIGREKNLIITFPNDFLGRSILGENKKNTHTTEPHVTSANSRLLSSSMLDCLCHITNKHAGAKGSVTRFVSCHYCLHHFVLLFVQLFVPQSRIFFSFSHSVYAFLRTTPQTVSQLTKLIIPLLPVQHR